MASELRGAYEDPFTTRKDEGLLSYKYLFGVV